MNQRIAQIMRGRPVHERLQIALMAAVAEAAHGPDGLNAIVDQVQPSGADFSAQVGGKPLHFYLGKSEAQIRAQAGDHADEVLSALEDRQIEVPERVTTRTGFEESEDRAQRGVRYPSAPHPDSPFAGGIPLGANAQTEPTFGDEQTPASELWGMSNEELLSQPGISQPALQQIRQLQWQHDEAARQFDAAAAQSATNQGFAAGQVQPPARGRDGLPIGPQAGTEGRIINPDQRRSAQQPVASDEALAAADKARQAAEGGQQRDEQADQLQEQGTPSRSASEAPPTGPTEQQQAAEQQQTAEQQQQAAGQGAPAAEGGAQGGGGRQRRSNR
jgi:hypothetical protein